MVNEFNYTTDDILNMLTVAMHVDHAYDESNWVKYFKIWSETFAEIQDKNDTIRQANDLDNCYGPMLDDEARNIGINRNGVDDDFLRFEIKARLLARVCDGSMPMLYKFISTSLGCSPSNVNIQPMYEVNGMPNAIQIKDIPLELVDDPRKTNLLLSAIKDAVADGIRVLYVSFKGFITSQLYVGIQPAINESISCDIGNSITDHGSSTGQAYIGVQPSIKEKISFDIGNSIKEKHSLNTNGYMGVYPAIKEQATIDAGNSINESFSTNITNYFAVHVLEPYVFSRTKIEHYYMDISDGIVNRSNINVTNYNGSHTIMGARIQI